LHRTGVPINALPSATELGCSNYCNALTKKPG